MTIKKVIRCGESRGETILISSWKCNYSIYLDIQVHYMDISKQYPHFKPSIGSWCVIINLSIIHVIYTALLKSDVFRHSKAYSSHSFQSTGIKRGSLWRGNLCILPIISNSCKLFYYYIFYLFILPPKKMCLSKISIIFFFLNR